MLLGWNFTVIYQSVAEMRDFHFGGSEFSPKERGAIIFEVKTYLDTPYT